MQKQKHLLFPVSKIASLTKYIHNYMLINEQCTCHRIEVNGMSFSVYLILFHILVSVAG